MKHPRITLGVSIVVAAAAFPACASDAGVERAPSGTGRAAPPAPSSSSGAAPTEELLAPPADGVQVKIVGTTIPAGADTEWCEVQEFPGTPGQAYYVNRVDLAKAKFSHHVFVNALRPGSEAEAKATELGVGERTNCVTAAASFGNGVVTVAGAAKNLQTVAFPEGVGQVFYGGQKLVIDYHYFNSSDTDVDAKVSANFHLVDSSEVKKIAHGFGVMNLTIDIPSQGVASFTSECLFNHDVLVGGLVRHTHRWGTTYKVWSVDANDQPTLLWTTEDWQNDIEMPFSQPMLMKAGTGFRYQCDYQNTEDHPLRFGEKANDEMCNLFGGWWAVNEGDEPGPQNCLITTVDADGIGRSTAGDTGAFNAISD